MGAYIGSKQRSELLLLVACWGLRQFALNIPRISAATLATSALSWAAKMMEDNFLPVSMQLYGGLSFHLGASDDIGRF